MRLQIMGDLHLERGLVNIPVLGDVIVLAGDIHVGCGGVTWAEQVFRGRPTLYVPGNHEFYGQTWPDLINDLRTAAAGSNVRILDDDAIVLDGVRFLGTTLWTDFSSRGYAVQDLAMASAKNSINDFRRIRKADGHPLRPQDVATKHQKSIEWLTGTLAQPFDGPTVVVTHHGPTPFSAHPDCRCTELTPAFVSNLEGMIRALSPGILWVSGHTHYSCDYRVGDSRVVSNQRGYEDLQEQNGFNPAFVIEV